MDHCLTPDALLASRLFMIKNHETELITFSVDDLAQKVKLSQPECFCVINLDCLVLDCNRFDFLVCGACPAWPCGLC